MQNYRPSDALMAKGDNFSPNKCLKNNFKEKEMQKIPYKLIVRSQMYAQVSTRPDIMYVTGILGRYLSNLRVDHCKVAKHVLHTYREQKTICSHIRCQISLRFCV